MIRKQFAGFVATSLAMAISAQALAGTVTTDGADLVIKTKGGLEVATTDKQFAFKIGGRLQADYSTFDGFYTKDGDAADAAYFRRAFLEISGVAYKDWAYTLNYDFSHNAGSASDGYWDEASIAYTGFSPVVIKVGRFDPAFGLEKATSSKWVTAPERNAAYDLVGFANGHENGMGIQISGTAANMFYGSAGLHAKDINDEDGESAKQLNLRGVFAPLNKPGNVVHLGVSYAKRDLDGESSSMKSRLGMRGVSTSGGNDAGDNGNRLSLGGGSGEFGNDTALGLEAAWAMGPLSVQGEYITRSMSGENGTSDVDADGYYAQVAYTLTGESRAYKLDGAKFDKISPSNKQIGAWEVFYRYDNISVDDDNGKLATVADVEGKVHNLGVNWYVNDAVKISGAYIKASVDNAENDDGDDTGDGLVFRAQYVF